MNKLRKNSKKGFTLVEIIVVLVIIAILIAALTPALIGWINEARESAVRSEGRTVMLALQTTAVEHRARTNVAPVRADYNPAPGVGDPTPTAAKFNELMLDAQVVTAAGVPVNPSIPVAVAPGPNGPNTQGSIGRIFVDAGGNVIGLEYGNPVRNRDTDGVGAGWLLIGRNTLPAGGAAGVMG
jgi:prepilin-type N-terminal cleavage/methylation domain-containing protein